MIDALPPLAAGAAAGAVMIRGGLCFNRALRRAAFGHGLTGLALGSFGSLLAVVCMALGALATRRLLLSSRPAIGGTERRLPAARSG
jgi:hypothetical protein